MRSDFGERGSALVVTLLVLVVLTILGTSIVFVSQTDNRTAENERRSAESLFLAEAGARQVKRWFDHPRSTTYCVAFPAAAVVDRTLRKIDVDGAGPAAPVVADGTLAKPYYKQGSDALFDRPYGLDLAEAFLGTADGPDARIDDASAPARAFLAELSEKLLPTPALAAVTARISRIDVYAPPYRPTAGVFAAEGVATITVVARVYRDADGAILAESGVTAVLDEVPYASASGPLRTCGDLTWTGAPPARWGAVAAAGTVTLPDHALVPASLAPPAEDALFLAYKEKIESQDGGLRLEDPWLRIVSGEGFVNAPVCAGASPSQPCPFLWDGVSDLGDGQLPAHVGALEGSHASLAVLPTGCSVLDYARFKRIATSGDRDVHFFAWESGATFRERGTGAVGELRFHTDGKTGLFFFDSVDGRPPRDEDGDGSFDNLAPGIEISGGTWGARGFLFWNGASLRIDAAGREATATPPGEPFQDANGDGRYDPGERIINLAYPATLAGEIRGSATDLLGGGVVRNAAGPGIATEASFWGLLLTSGSFDRTGEGTILGSLGALGRVTESEPGAPTVEIHWESGLASGWPPEGWDLPRVFVTSWRTGP